MRRPERRELTDLVLVGGGHAHVQVLKRLAMEPLSDLRVTLVVDTPVAVYSGMVPGYVAGQYAREAVEIDVLPLARLAGAGIILSAATGIDPEARRLELDDRPSIPYDIVSLDIGSSVSGLDTPGVREHALSTRPIGRFVETLDRRLAALSDDAPPRIVVVGGGAGGVELGFTLRERLRAKAREAEVRILEAGDRILSGYAPALSDRVAREAAERGVRIETGRSVEAVQPDAVYASGERIPADLVVWVTGAAPVPRFRPSGLATDDRGFLRTRPTLQVVGQDAVLAVGDCATPVEDPWMPKAGVYAVRQGPVLAENLRRLVAGAPLRTYRPQRDFLTLLNLGDGTAIGTKWGRSFSGPWAFRFKDWIDRRFTRRFQVLEGRARVSPEFSTLAEMRADMDVLCGGCAAKLGQAPLQRTLGRLPRQERSSEVELGLAEGDDAAAYRVNGGTLVVSSVDQFRAFTDDAYLVGRVGAVNAASDILAKGVRPSFAQAIVALPEDAAPAAREEILFQLLSGARRELSALGVELVGGHTTTASELLVGFQIEGFGGAEEELLSIDRLRTGQVLILTKPLGTGVLWHADMRGRARGGWVRSAIAAMLRPNADAARIARAHGATAATDVTGFGLAGHLAAMVEASGVAAEIELSALPALPGVEELLGAGLRSTFHEENERGARGIRALEGARAHSRWPLLFDPQTSGGLLFGVPADRAVDALDALRSAGDPGAAAIGRVGAASEEPLTVTAGRAREPG